MILQEHEPTTDRIASKTVASFLVRGLHFLCYKMHDPTCKAASL